MINKIEKFSQYKFQIFEEFDDCNSSVKTYTYNVYREGYQPYESFSNYETEQEARFAAIGHIDELEKWDS